MFSSLGGVQGSSSATRSAWVENLVQQTMAIERRPLTRLQQNRDELNIRRAIYGDISTKLQALRTASQNLTGSEGVFNKMTATSSTSGVATASASANATPAAYQLEVAWLAQAHRLSSAQQASSTTPLGISGQFSVQGVTITVEAEDSLAAIRDKINQANYDEGQEVTATIVDRRLILTGANTGASARIELADLGGGAVLQSLGYFSRSVDHAENLAAANGVTGFSTAELISFEGGALSGYAELTGSRYYVEIGSGANANKFRVVDSAGRAVAIASTSGGSIATTDWVAIDPQNLSYDTGRGLVITFSDDGEWSAKGYESGAASVNLTTPQLQAARDARLTINGLEITRAQNGNLTDIIEDLTLNLHDAGSTRIVVGRENSAVVNHVQTLLNRVNDLLTYLSAKTELQLTPSGSDNTSYTRPPLHNDWTVRSLRRELVNDLLGSYSEAAPGAVRRLAEVGITLAERGLSLQLSDRSALESALSSNFSAVADMFEHILGQVDARMAPFLDGASTIISVTQSGIDAQIRAANNRIQTTEARLRVRQEALRRQFLQLQAQIAMWQDQGESSLGFLLGSVFNRQY